MNTKNANLLANFDIDTTKQIAEIINSLSGTGVETVNVFTMSISDQIRQSIDDGCCNY